MNILRNAIRTPDGTILESRSRHDYVTHVDANGEEYMVDGGLSYSRQNINKVPAESLVITTEDKHEDIREGFSWGTYGINGDQPLKHVFLKDMDKDHIEAILKTQTHVPEYMRDMFRDELQFREER